MPMTRNPRNGEPVSLHSLAGWINGLAFKSINFSLTGKPVIKIAEVKQGIGAQTKFTDSTYDQKYRVVTGDMIFCWSGQPETSIGTSYWRGTEGWLNQHLFKVIPDSTLVSPDFFYYVLQSLQGSFVERARNKQTTGLGHVTKRDLTEMEVCLPPLAEQRRIAGVLGALDDLIDTNHRLAAQSEELLGMTFRDLGFDTEGIEPATLDNLVEVNPVTPKPQGPVPYVDMASLDTRSARISGFTERTSATSVRFRNGDALMARITPCLENGKGAFVDCLPDGATASGSSEFIVLRSRGSLSACWPYFLLRSDRFRAYAIRHMTGTSGRQRCPADSVKKYPISKPSDEAAAIFTRIADPLVEALTTLAGESDELRRTRDELLPLLMSGAVSPSVAVAS